MNQCQGVTQHGKQCRKRLKYGSYCSTHIGGGFEELPLELKMKIAMDLRKQQASELVQTSHVFGGIQNEHYWQLRTQQDFGYKMVDLNSRGNYPNWASYYKYLNRITNCTTKIHLIQPSDYQPEYNSITANDPQFLKTIENRRPGFYQSLNRGDIIQEWVSSPDVELFFIIHFVDKVDNQKILIETGTESEWRDDFLTLIPKHFSVISQFPINFWHRRSLPCTEYKRCNVIWHSYDVPFNPNDLNLVFKQENLLKWEKTIYVTFIHENILYAIIDNTGSSDQQFLDVINQFAYYECGIGSTESIDQKYPDQFPPGITASQRLFWNGYATTVDLT